MFSEDIRKRTYTQAIRAGRELCCPEAGVCVKWLLRAQILFGVLRDYLWIPTAAQEL